MQGRDVNIQTRAIIENAKGADLSFKHRAWYWFLLAPLIVGAAFALLRYAGWSAVYSGNYGLPSETWRLKEASHEATVYWRILMGFGGSAIIVATMLIPPLTSQRLHPAIRGIGGFVLALALVATSIIVASMAIAVVSHQLK